MSQPVYARYERRPLGLTRRHLQIAEGYARGLSQKQIADELGITVKTVKTMVTEAGRRLDGPGLPRHKLTVYALTHPKEAA